MRATPIALLLAGALAACTRTPTPAPDAASGAIPAAPTHPASPATAKSGARTAPVPGDAGRVPQRFQGRYAADAGACADASAESQLVIGPDHIQFYESSGDILSVASGNDDLAVTARLAGEGEVRQATYRFALSGDGRVLTDLGGGMRRQRCD